MTHHTRILLIEVYRMPDDPARHKETAQHQAWRDAVAEMMAEPHHSISTITFSHMMQDGDSDTPTFKITSLLEGRKYGMG